MTVLSLSKWLLLRLERALTGLPMNLGNCRKRSHQPIALFVEAAGTGKRAAETLTLDIKIDQAAVLRLDEVGWVNQQAWAV